MEHEMTEEEVRSEYKFAKNPKMQIQILADINAETPKIIKRVIEGQTWEEAKERRRPKSRYIPKGISRPWTYNEIQRIKELYKKGYYRKEMAEEVKRTVSAVGAKINQLRKDGELI